MSVNLSVFYRLFSRGTLPALAVLSAFCPQTAHAEEFDPNNCTVNGIRGDYPYTNYPSELVWWSSSAFANR